MTAISVRTGVTDRTGVADAVAELVNAIAQPDMAVVLFFASSRYDLEALGSALDKAFSCPVVGCTSAGEFVSGHGYRNGSIVAASIRSDRLRVHTRLFTSLSTFTAADAGVAASALAAQTAGGQLVSESMFGLFLVDGLRMSEERMIAALQGAFGCVPIVGGSAGDDLRLNRTSVYHQGTFLSDAAVLALFETSLPFTVLQTQHFIRSDRRFEITSADPDSRTVFTMDGRRAAEVYAEALGVREEELDAELFSLHPLILRLGGRNYVRALRTATSDGALVFNSAIDQGLSLYLGTGNDIVANLENALYDSLVAVPRPRLLIGCECVHRRLEVEAGGLTQQVRQVLDRMEYVGFHTYGEQVDSLHVNQTFTGIILGDAYE